MKKSSFCDSEFETLNLYGTVYRYLSRCNDVKFEINTVNGSPVGTMMYILVLWIYIYPNIFGYKNCTGSRPGFDPIGHKPA
jgi:hypothetical protein